MTGPPLWLLPALGCAITLLLPLYAGRARGRQYALFSGVVSLLSFPMAVLLALRLSALLGDAVGWVFVYGFAAAGAHATHLVNARLRHDVYRYAVSLPGMALQALGALSLLYFAAVLPLHALFWWFDFPRAGAVLLWLDLLPVLAIAAGVVTSFGVRREVVRFRAGALAGPVELARWPVQRLRAAARAPAQPEMQTQPRDVSTRARKGAGGAGDVRSGAARERDAAARVLRIVQISDPHLGPWQPVARLQRRICELLEHAPDLVLLTGDYLTMEGNGTPGCLTEALAPLAAHAGRTFACFGNHDHEAPGAVRAAMEANGVRLLVDEGALVETARGAVQILGADFHRRARAERLAALCARFPRRAGVPRVLLLHDPSHFHELAHGDANAPDLTLAGHTHGGQIGLVSFGANWTVLARSRWPDHGLFAKGARRLYVHRGTGFYGFPLRIGVPGEASLLEVEWEAEPRAARACGAGADSEVDRKGAFVVS